MAPNKATLAFQDERQVYRREFMRAELQRVELGLRGGGVGESGKEAASGEKKRGGSREREMERERERSTER